MPLVALAPPGGSNDLDRYELLFRFAAGGMAEVFVARQRGEGGFLRPVAIKRMLPALAEEPKFVEMFLDEARLAAHVQSPYVVSTLDCGKDEEGSPYIVMELVVGVSLSQALRACVEKKRHVPLDVFAEVMAQTALGLYDAHHARTPTGQPLEIVHRDVSPQNVLVGVDGRARLTDFGVARALERVTRTSTGEVKGKLSYFSPEQARMEAIDQRSDIFALGIVAWETLALERLFSRESPMAALQAILHERIPDVREHNPDVPERVAAVIAKALERDVSRRHANARIFADELRAAVGTPASAAAVGRWVEESGGPRLATFRKKIEASFKAGGDGPTEVAISSERERSSPSGASKGSFDKAGFDKGSFGSAPESRLVGSLGTLPDRAPDAEGAITEVRAARTPVSAPIAPAPPPVEIAVPTTSWDASPAPSVEPVRPAPRSSAPLVATLAIALLALGGGAGLYAMQSASVAPTPTALPAVPTIATTPSTPVTPPPTTDTRAALLPPPPTDEVRLGPDPRAHGPRHTQARDEVVPPSTRGEAQGTQTTLHAEAPEITQPAHVDPPAVIVPPATSEPRPEHEGVRTPERSEERHDPAPERTTERPPERADPPATTTPPATTEGARLQVGTGVGRLRGSH